MFSVYLSEAGRVDRLHAVLAAEVDVVEVDHVPRDAHALRQLVVPLCGCKISLTMITINLWKQLEPLEQS